MRERGMRVQFQPDIDTKVRQCTNRGSKTDRLANPAAPVGGVAGFSGTTLASNCAKERNVARTRFNTRQLDFERFRSRTHKRMMKGMIYPNESGERALRFQFRRHRFERN